MRLEKYSLGTGDRFSREAKAQLQAVIKAKNSGAEIAIVWNKSYREHAIIHTDPVSVREAADRAVKELNWTGSYYIDADHINLKTVDGFIESSDFFTLDVAEYIGREVSEDDMQNFLKKYSVFTGTLSIPGVGTPFTVTPEVLKEIAGKYLAAVKEAGRIYRHIEKIKGRDNFITEVSMDETENPQTPLELFFILASLSSEDIPLQTIAPKFTGRFNKGVDYRGDIARFEQEFNDDLYVISFAVRQFGLSSNVKLSVHSGSDKFSIYPVIKRALRVHDAGLHIKTAGTTWLEELIGLAEAGGEGLAIAKDVYSAAYARYEELSAPYADVIDIDREKLPLPREVEKWTAQKYADTLRHDSKIPEYNMNVRQLLHIGYKVASEMGVRYTDALEKFRAEIGRNVTENLFERHIKALFLNEE